MYIPSMSSLHTFGCARYLFYCDMKIKHLQSHSPVLWRYVLVIRVDKFYVFVIYMLREACFLLGFTLFFACCCYL